MHLLFVPAVVPASSLSQAQRLYRFQHLCLKISAATTMNMLIQHVLSSENIRAYLPSGSLVIK
jgi:hypothetical protein